MEELQPQTIKVMFDNLNDKLDLIHAQTSKTNGSVGKAFDEINKLKQWRSYIMGGLAVITILLVPILLFMANDFLSKPNIQAINTTIANDH